MSWNYCQPRVIVGLVPRSKGHTVPELFLSVSFCLLWAELIRNDVSSRRRPPAYLSLLDYAAQHRPDRLGLLVKQSPSTEVRSEGGFEQFVGCLSKLGTWN